MNKMNRILCVNLYQLEKRYPIVKNILCGLKIVCKELN